MASEVLLSLNLGKPAGGEPSQLCRTQSEGAAFLTRFPSFSSAWILWTPTVRFCISGKSRLCAVFGDDRQLSPCFLSEGLGLQFQDGEQKTGKERDTEKC